MRNYYLYNEYHLGDNVFNAIYFNIISYYLEKENYFIYYYCQPDYILQVNEFVNSKNVMINDISKKPATAVQLWINNSYFKYTLDYVYTKIINKSYKRVNYNKYYRDFFNVVSYKFQILIKIERFYYKDYLDLASRYKNINKIYNNKYKNIDLLIINSQPLSGQYNYNKLEWDNYITLLNNKYKLVTTTKVENIKCTMDDNLTIKDIAAISNYVKVIIAVNSGVIPGTLNKKTLKNIKQVYIFDDRCYFSYPNFQNKEKIEEITCEELNKYIK